MTDIKHPNECATMAELRKEIDVIDKMLIELLMTRSGYIDRAVELKKGEKLPARIVERVEEALNNVKTRATELGLDECLAETLWTELIEWSIEKERKHLGDAYAS